MPLEPSQPALRLAIDLVHVPSRAHALRRERLPSDVDVLLRIASGDEAVIQDAARTTGRYEQVIRDAATFYVEQVMLSPDADSYRVLGATPFASAEELRRNMALLMHWLHPDLRHDPHRSVLATRVSQAWETVKTVERRMAYDQLQLTKLETRERSRNAKSRGLTRRGGATAEPAGPPGRNRRAAMRFVRFPGHYQPGRFARAMDWLRTVLRLH